MKKLIFLITSLLIFSEAISQIESANNSDNNFLAGMNVGVNCSYNDKEYNVAYAASLTFEYHVIRGHYIQFAPKYSWLQKWNEHYLTLPLHVRKNIGNRFSVFAGPAITFDLGYFKDLGFSGGINYHIRNRSSIVLSIYSFTLYDYDIDYLYVPIGLSYHNAFLD